MDYQDIEIAAVVLLGAVLMLVFLAGLVVGLLF
jgi:hypothetical protein